MGALDCTVLNLGIEGQRAPVDESNRAWIAFWNIVVLPPFAEDGAWRLLNLVNDPATEISNLLPFTLARVPGLKYRGVQDPNVLNETRLPPPEDKAVGFNLLHPGEHPAAAYRGRQADDSSRFMKPKSATDHAKAQGVLEDAQRTAAMIKQARANFVDAARAHAVAMSAPSRVQAPEIVPHHVLTYSEDDAESPYRLRPQSRLRLAQR